MAESQPQEEKTSKKKELEKKLTDLGNVYGQKCAQMGDAQFKQLKLYQAIEGIKVELDKIDSEAIEVQKQLQVLNEATA